jgi:small subunit ribosomal protein S10
MDARAILPNPVRFPVKVKRFTVLRSPHIDKKSREQFELKTHKNLYVLKLSTDLASTQLCESLKKTAFAGIGISLKKVTTFTL